MSTSTESSPEAGKRHTLKDFQTRFLWPFVLDRWNKGALRVLCEEKFGAAFRSVPRPLVLAASSGLQGRVARITSPHSCSPICQSRPPSRTVPMPRSRDAATSGSWTRRPTSGSMAPRSAPSGGATMPVDVVAGVGIELFLSPQGIGVLSLALRPAKEGLSHDEAIDFNYRIAQFRRRQYCAVPQKAPLGAARLRQAEPGPESRHSPAARGVRPTGRSARSGGWYVLICSN